MGSRKSARKPDWKIFLGDEAAFGGNWGHVWYGQQVIMAFNPKAHRYRLATALMRKPPPTAAELDKTAEEIRADESWEYVPGSFMMARSLLDLIYSGNGQYVDKLLDLGWNPKFSDKAKFRTELIECHLRESSWWPELAEFNGWPALKPNC